MVVIKIIIIGIVVVGVIVVVVIILVVRAIVVLVVEVVVVWVAATTCNVVVAEERGRNSTLQSSDTVIDGHRWTLMDVITLTERDLHFFMVHNSYRVSLGMES